MKRAISALTLIWGLSACMGPSSAGPDGGLMYRVPEAPAVTYLTGDTSNIDIDAGPMGNLRIRGTSAATLGMTFEKSLDGSVQVTATYEDLDARMSQPMGGAQTADEEDLEGPLVFTMDPRGHSTIVLLPEMKGQAAELATPQSLAYQFFPLLPGGAADAGDMWTDTIHFEAEIGQGETTSTTVMTYTLEGDTVVDGMSLLKIGMSGTTDVTTLAVTQGMDVTQIFSGDITGTALWDPARSLYVGGYSEAEMSGSVEVPAAGMPPMPLTVSAKSHVKLQGG